MGVKSLLLPFVAVLGLFAMAATPVFAQEEEPITQEKIALIRERCVENQASLNRLHQTDAFLRTDLGDLYRTISGKLMVPLNQRLVANRLDGGELITVAAEFEAEYDRFYASYIAYDNAMSELLAIDCTKQPVTFYNALLKARAERADVGAHNVRLKQLIVRYGEEFSRFKAEWLKEHAS